MQWLGAHPVTARSLLTLRPDTPRDTMGGARSDMGYALLGDMVAHAAEEPFDTYMRRAILRPLNISRAGYQADERMLELRAAGYRRGKPWSEAPLDNAAPPRVVDEFVGDGALQQHAVRRRPLPRYPSAQGRVRAGDPEPGNRGRWHQPALPAGPVLAGRAL